MQTTISVRHDQQEERSYPIHIRPGILNDLAFLLFRRHAGRDIFIITDSRVRKLYGRPLLKNLLVAGFNAWLLDFPPGETSKNSDVIFSLQTRLLEHGVRRDSVIIALGGGVVGDVAGFAAATVLRGVKYVQVPTSLLAQVDSSVGGKVGINHPIGKNLVGAFHRPEAVYIDPMVLKTLSRTEFRNGLAELVKIAAALDGEFFRLMERSVMKLSHARPDIVERLIARAVRLKAMIIRKDERDMGLRKTLNLGHTIGHAIEAATDHRVQHGAAVAMGLAAESRIALNMGLLNQAAYARLLKLLRALRLPTAMPGSFSRSRFLAALSADKKSVGNVPQFVLLKGIGHSVVGVEVPTPFIVELLKN